MGNDGLWPTATAAGARNIVRAVSLVSLTAIVAGCSAGSPAPRSPVLQYTGAAVLPEAPMMEAPAIVPPIPAPVFAPKPAIPHESTAAVAAERKEAIAKVGKPYQVMGRWYYPKHEPDYQATGMASWYGPDFHGKRTANGEIYNMQRLTGAHPTLPLPSYVEVTNLANGRTIVVRINDRGPYKRGRIIDLSKRAAELLGYTRSGTAKVSVRYVKEAPLTADVSFEERFLARQPWYQPKVASAALPEPQAADPGPAWTATTTPLATEPADGSWAAAAETVPAPRPAAKPAAKAKTER
jgi:rare lipoprotein A